jgi:hypothetical protein
VTLATANRSLTGGPETQRTVAGVSQSNRRGFSCEKASFAGAPKIEEGWPKATAEAERSDLLGNAGLTERPRSEEEIGRRTDVEPNADGRTGTLAHH